MIASPTLHRLLSGFLALMCAALLAACGGGGDTPVAGSNAVPETRLLAAGGGGQANRSTLTIAPSSPSLAVGGTVAMAASITTNNRTVRANNVTWSSSNPAVATVNAQGVVTGVSAGTAIITAKSGGLTATTTITVNRIATTLTFDEFANLTELTNQYQHLGVTVQGGTVQRGDFTPWPYYSSPNILMSYPARITFTFDTSITGPITSVSAYLSGVPGTRIEAYDAFGTLVGQSESMTESDNNVFRTATSTGAPITTVIIRDGGNSFAIDNFTF
jgi:hypothetical protein